MLTVVFQKYTFGAKLLQKALSIKPQFKNIEHVMHLNGIARWLISIYSEILAFCLDFSSWNAWKPHLFRAWLKLGDAPDPLRALCTIKPLYSPYICPIRHYYSKYRTCIYITFFRLQGDSIHGPLAPYEFIWIPNI